jgi:signal transduction histidine kinase/transcriptional regulator with XRE-family HTH domain
LVRRSEQNQLVQLIRELELREEVAGSLREIFRILNSNRPVEEVLDFIIEQAQKTLGADDVGIYRLEMHGDIVYLRPERGFTANYITELAIQTQGGGIVAETVLQQKPLIISDTDLVMERSAALMGSDEQRDLVRKLYMDNRAILAVPFIIKNEVYGGIILYYRQPRGFTQEEVALAMSISDQAALAIENSQAKKQIEQRARVAEGLRDVFTILNSNRPSSEALEFIVKRTRELLGADSVGLYRISDDMTRVQLDAGWGMGLEKMTGAVIPFFAGAMDEKYSREPLVLPDVSVMIDQLLKASPTAATDDTGMLEGIKSMIATPVHVKDKLYGSLHLYFAEQRQFAAEDVELAKTFGDQAALALENSQSHDQTERRAKVAESLRDIMEVLNSDMPFDKVLDRIVSQASNLLGAAAVAVYKLFPEEALLRIQAAAGLSAEYAAQMSIPVGEAAVGKAVLTKEPFQVYDISAAFTDEDDIASDPKRRQLLHKLVVEYRSVLAVPLIIKDEVYGGITVYYQEPREWSAEDIDLASTFANHIALAIEHERLDARSKEAAVSTERNRLARELHDAVTQTLFSASLIAEVLPRIWDKDEEAGRQRLEELRGLTRGALAEMRTLLLELRPKALLDADLRDLLQQLADAATTAGRVPVDVVIKGDTPVPGDVKVTFYRIAQEALNNVAKHSGATEAEITLLLSDKTAEMRVLDNGRGFEGSPGKPDSLGLGIMTERAAVIGGELIIKSELGRGTSVIIRWTNNRG